ncbi:hypothetical protein E4T56_gene8216 [Termitomyces sp. T112]|nr:hypothetical protein E4T56_gene8216 [Termitomyces sp. T112]
MPGSGSSSMPPTSSSGPVSTPHEENKDVPLAIVGKECRDERLARKKTRWNKGTSSLCPRLDERTMTLKQRQLKNLRWRRITRINFDKGLRGS